MSNFIKMWRGTWESPTVPCGKSLFYAPTVEKKTPNFVNYLSLTWFCLGKKNVSPQGLQTAS